MKRKPLTVKGAERLRAELRRLKTEDRPRVIQAIAEARAHGDLSENAEYHAAANSRDSSRVASSSSTTSCPTAKSSTWRTCCVRQGGVRCHVDLEDQDDGSESCSRSWASSRPT